jgi:site-specific DNA-cytosine methylase
MTQPLAVDIYCGLGGWTEGLLAEGYRVIGFDNERHVYGDERYPGQLVLQDVRTLHGKQFKDAALIVASPPCQYDTTIEEDRRFSKATPSGEITMFVDNPPASDFLIEGGVFYVDFTAVPKPEPVQT